MEQPREWMYKRRTARGVFNQAFIDGIEDFANYAFGQMQYVWEGQVRCPCKPCKNLYYVDRSTLGGHLLANGFMKDYYIWSEHGESIFYHNRNLNNPTTYHYGGSSQQANFVLEQETEPEEEDNADANPNRFEEMVMDIGGPAYDPHIDDDEVDPFSSNLNDMYRSAQQPLYDGSTHSQLEAVSRLINIKADHNISERCYDDLVSAFKTLLPEQNTMPKSFYETKKMMKAMGLPVQKIHCCERYCMLFWGEDLAATSCKFCQTSRYKDESEGFSRRRKPIPRKVMYYLPIIPRLKRLFQSAESAENMRWHKEHESTDGVMEHPSESQAWKHFDEVYPDFKADPRNIRLGLCTDGFAAHGQFGKNYSSWPIVLTVYNLPPWLSMKEENMFLSVFCPGPKNPKHKVDVFLQPLIAELQELWSCGVKTWDASTKRYFRMKAALLWTISDFPAYAMLSGWSTAGKKACPYCMDHSTSFYLKHGRKVCWFDNTRKFLSRRHPYVEDEKEFLKGKNAKEHIKPPIKTGWEIFQEIQYLGLMKVTELGYEEHNAEIIRMTHCGWRKRSIFWDLPYWTTNLIRHNLDVMHIEKNFFDNLWNTIMSIPGKTKDNDASRKDLAKDCGRAHAYKQPNKQKYPKAPYQLKPDEVKAVARWVRGLKFPDGFVSNLSRLVDDNVDVFKSGWKSHDCHVFMQKILPIALKPFLTEATWDAITCISTFFRELTSAKISEARMRHWEKNIPVILCNLERLFPPSFFDVMEHLVIHLPYEARMAGPVQCRWMYPFERNLGKLKKTAKNKARIEGSIVNAYITKEAAFLSSRYLGPDVVTKNRSVGRNDDGGTTNNPYMGNISVFKFPGRPSGRCKQRYLTDEEYQDMHCYILTNCWELDTYVTAYMGQLRSCKPGITRQEIGTRLRKEFPSWLVQCLHMNGNQDDDLLALAESPLRRVSTYQVYFMNGSKYHTIAYEANKKTTNSGVALKGQDLATDNIDFYGRLEEILVIEYPRTPIKRIAMFKCMWFDPRPAGPRAPRGTRKIKRHNFVEVHRDGRYECTDPFIFADQAMQVSYLTYPYTTRFEIPWLAVCTVKQKLFSDTSLTNETEEDELPAFQEIQMMTTLPISIDSLTVNLNIEDEGFIDIDENEEQMENLEEQVENDDFDPVYFSDEYEEEEEDESDDD